MKRKVAAGGLGGAVVVVLLSLIHGLTGARLDGEVGSALTVIVTFLIAYYIPDADTATPVGASEKG